MPVLADEALVRVLGERWVGRGAQVGVLGGLFDPHRQTTSPASLVIHGLPATGKSAVTRDYLEGAGIPHVVVSGGECVTARHLLERTVGAVLGALEGGERSGVGRCENVCALVVHLQRMLEGRGRFVIVFDGVDGVREGGREVVPALARLGEMIPNLSTILILTVPRPRFLHAAGVPHLHFPPYTRSQALAICSRNPPPIFTSPPTPSKEYTEDLAAEDDAWVWSRYLCIVWDSLAKGAARDVVSFRGVAERLWREFVKPIEEGTFGTRDFSRLVVSRKGLFQSDAALVESIVRTGEVKRLKVTHDLPYYSKFLLCAAYLASYNPARQDSLYFMRASEKKRKRRGGGGAIGSRIAKNRKIPRHLLAPSPFTLDRLLAIFHAILPHPVSASQAQTADLGMQVASLSSLRLLLRTGAAAAAQDPLDGGCKWRVNFGAEYVGQLGRSVGFELGEWLGGEA